MTLSGFICLKPTTTPTRSTSIISLYAGIYGAVQYPMPYAFSFMGVEVTSILNSRDSQDT